MDNAFFYVQGHSTQPGMFWRTHYTKHDPKIDAGGAFWFGKKTVKIPAKHQAHVAKSYRIYGVQMNKSTPKQ